MRKQKRFDRFYTIMAAEYFTFRDLDFIRRIPAGLGYEEKGWHISEMTVETRAIHAIYRSNDRYIADMSVNFRHHYNEVRITESDYNKLTEIFTKQIVAL